MQPTIIQEVQTLLKVLLSDTVESTTLLFSSGLLDSIALLEVVQLVERHWSIQFHWSEVTLDNLDSLEKIANFVQSKIQI